MSDIQLVKQNEAWMKVICDPGIAMELQQEFTFFAEGYRWSPKFKCGFWDGKIKLFNLIRKTMYAGLYEKVVAWAEANGYSVEADAEFAKDAVTDEEFDEFLSELKLPLTPHKHQRDAIKHCIEERNAFLISPTASGKSYIMYILAQWYKEKRVLLIVPTLDLVAQMESDFKEYGWNEGSHTIFAGQSKHSKARLVISTWQSIYEMPEEWFQQFDVVFGDEADGFKAASLIKLMTSMTTIKYRFGFTGTTDGNTVNELVLIGLFGPFRQVITTAQMIEKKISSALNIVTMVLQWPESIRKQTKRMEWQSEMDFLFANKQRNDFIARLALSLKGNTLILFNRVEKHGKILHELIKERCPHENVFFVSGETPKDEREEIRQKVNTLDNAIVLASVVWVRGTNIPNLNNLVFPAPMKSQVRVLQSIGRILRKTNSKSQCTLYDIADDLHWKSWTNTTFRMYVSRLKIYVKEKFPYHQHIVRLKDANCTLETSQR